MATHWPRDLHWREYLRLVSLSPFAFIHGDWDLWSALPAALADGSLYALDTPVPYVWSPVLAPVMGLVAVTGFWPQAIAQLGMVLMLRDRLLVALFLGSTMFWPAVFGGNPLFTLSLITAVLAYRGRWWASLVYLALAMMIPRPLFMPLALWLLWKRPELRRPFIFLFVAHAAVVVASGYAVPWVVAAVAHAGAPPIDLGVTLLVGQAWLLVGIPLATWLTLRGRPGWAGLAASPYVLPGYLLMPLISLEPAGPPRKVLPSKPD